MRTYHDLYSEGRDRLEKAGQGQQAALLLLSELCQANDIDLYREMEQVMPEAIQADYLEAVHRMEKGEPMDYVLGFTWFYGYKIGVSPAVLIPRPETEELTALVLRLCDEHFTGRDLVRVFDVGTGSGAIAISLASEEPKMNVWASDISQTALAQAEKNARSLGADVQFLAGSMLEPYIENGLHCDILVCNPPYIPDQEQVERSVKDFEPGVALFGGEDGLQYYRDVFENAGKVMAQDGILAFEMGWNQGAALSALAREHFPDARIQVHKDINGKDRMLTVELGKKE